MLAADGRAHPDEHARRDSPAWVTRGGAVWSTIASVAAVTGGAPRAPVCAAMDDLERQESNNWPEETAHGRKRTVRTRTGDPTRGPRHRLRRRKPRRHRRVHDGLSTPPHGVVVGYAWSRPGLDRKTKSMLNL